MKTLEVYMCNCVSNKLFTLTSYFRYILAFTAFKSVCSAHRIPVRILDIVYGKFASFVL